MTRPVLALLIAGLCAGTAAAGPFGLYVAEGNSITVFDAAGTRTVFASGLNNPYGLAFDAAGNLYTTTADNTVRRFSPTGADLGTFAATGPNSQPFGLAFDAAGNLYTTNAGNGSVRRFSPTGADLGTFAAGGLNLPIGLAFDMTGNLYAASFFQNAIRRFSPTGVNLGSLTAGLGRPYGLAFDVTGNLYAANSFDNTIRRFSPTGADLGTFASVGLNNPRYLAFSPTSGGLPLPNYLRATASPVPEPGSLAALGLLAAIGWAVRRSVGEG